MRAQAADPEALESLSSLYEWLEHDVDPSDDVTVECTTHSRHDGGMAGSFDTIIAISGQVASFANVILAYLTWRSVATQNSDVTASLRVRAEINGSSLEIDGLSDAQLKDLIESLRGQSDSNQQEA